MLTPQQTWSGFSPTAVPDNNRQSRLSPTTVPKMSTGSYVHLVRASVKAEVLSPTFYGGISSYFVVSFSGMRYLSTPLTFFAVNIH